MSLTSRGFQIKSVRKSAKGTTRDTVLSLHQKQIQNFRDTSGNFDNDRLSEYYLKNGDLLMKYYDMIHNHIIPTPDVTPKDIQGSVLEYMNISNRTQSNKNTTTGGDDTSKIQRDNHLIYTTIPDETDIPIQTNEYGPDDIIQIQRSRIKKMDPMTKEDIYEEFYSNIDNSYIPQKYRRKPVEVCHCPVCGNEMILIPANANMFCEKCGREDQVLIDIDLPGMKEQNKDTSYFNYRKINHFNEWLAQFQAKETTDIPPEIYDMILLEFRKERRKDISDLTPKKLRGILKRLNMNKYYEHIPHIINRLNGIPPPRLSPETEETLRRMFREIQTPFMKHCPSWRKNFLSYSYVLHKFCRILGKDEFLICFPLLKSREKLYDMDKVWKLICDDLGWEFHRSI
jgi:hypothetical protein